MVFLFKTGDTDIGSDATNDIVLKAGDIAERHSKIVLIDDCVCLHRIDGECCVNQTQVTETTPINLSHGDTVCFGSRTYFRYNNPEEAKKLRDVSADKNMSNNSTNNWSPLTKGNFSTHSEKLSQLEQERDELRQQQMQIESEYEEKIKNVLEQLKSEKEGKAALEEELERLREQKLNASIRMSSFSASTPLTQGPDQSLFPSIIPANLGLPSPNTSSSNSSLTFDDQFNRQVIGEETGSPTIGKKNPRLEEYPVDSFKNERMRSNSNISRIQQYSVSYSHGDFLIEPDKPTDKRVIDGEQSDDYLLLEADSSESTDGQSEIERFKAEKDELKARYEEQLEKETKEKEKMHKEILELELKLQLGSDQVARRRSYAFDGDSGTNSGISRSRPSYYSHRAARVKVDIPQHILRGTGWSSYHVFEVLITISRDGWRVCRTYPQFRDFHTETSAKYPEISALVFPPSKWIGYRLESFVTTRRVQLERYLKNFIAIMTTSVGSPIAETQNRKITIQTIQNFHSFFKPGPLHGQGIAQSYSAYNIPKTNT